jgi:hypothetical protein
MLTAVLTFPQRETGEPMVLDIIVNKGLQFLRVYTRLESCASLPDTFASHFEINT